MFLNLISIWLNGTLMYLDFSIHFKMVNQSLLSLFGLVFGEELEEMGHGTTGVAFVMNINSMVTNFSGLFTGYVLKKYSFRRVTAFGVILTAVGMILCSVATNIWHILISYSLFCGIKT